MKEQTFNPDLKELLEGENGDKSISRYSLVSSTAKLAREISDEANMEGEILTEKPVSMALEKLLDGEYTIEEPLEIRDL
ncbi:MAG: DNA-directed RNA polymerase subunit omega [Clostridia bacterium]|nr:DNA-directed RNA polymerase subunit omega [Clostridia bacterium]